MGRRCLVSEAASRAGFDLMLTKLSLGLIFGSSQAQISELRSGKARWNPALSVMR